MDAGSFVAHSRGDHGSGQDLLQTLIMDNKELRVRVRELEDLLMESEGRAARAVEDVLGRAARAHEILPKVHMLEERLMQTERLVTEAAHVTPAPSATLLSTSERPCKQTLCARRHSISLESSSAKRP